MSMELMRGGTLQQYVAGRCAGGGRRAGRAARAPCWSSGSRLALSCCYCPSPPHTHRDDNAQAEAEARWFLQQLLLGIDYAHR